MMLQVLIQMNNNISDYHEGFEFDYIHFYQKMIISQLNIYTVSLTLLQGLGYTKGKAASRPSYRATARPLPLSERPRSGLFIGPLRGPY